MGARVLVFTPRVVGMRVRIERSIGTFSISV